MTLGELRELLADVPDEAVLLVEVDGVPCSVVDAWVARDSQDGYAVVIV